MKTGLAEFYSITHLVDYAGQQTQTLNSKPIERLRLSVHREKETEQENESSAVCGNLHQVLTPVTSSPIMLLSSAAPAFATAPAPAPAPLPVANLRTNASNLLSTCCIDRAPNVEREGEREGGREGGRERESRRDLCRYLRVLEIGAQHKPVPARPRCAYH